MLAEARHCTLINGMRCELEYVSIVDERGLPEQRFDALMMLTFDVQRPWRAGSWALPWIEQHATEQPPLCLALEVDRGTEKLAVLYGKARMYQALTEEEHYHRTLGGPAIPVVLAPTWRRAMQIAEQWQRGWPEGQGLVSTFADSRHPHYGVLWGQYRRLNAAATEPTSILAECMGATRETWAELRDDG